MIGLLLPLLGLGTAAGAGPSRTAAPTSGGSQCTGGTMSVVAHPDDDLYFQSPDLQDDLRPGKCHRSVYVTAGDAGGGPDYWEPRERGIEAAYAFAFGVDDDWRTETFTSGDNPIRVRVLNPAPSVSLAFLRLPDGYRLGTGSNRYGFQSIPKLLDGEIGRIDAIDGSADYTAVELRNALLDLINDARPDQIRTLDYVHAMGSDNDHFDHHAVGLLAQDASRYASHGHGIVGYLGYTTNHLPQNLDGTPLRVKTEVYDAYQAEALPDKPLQHDPYLFRQYRVGASASGPLADAGPDRAASVGQPVTLDGSLSRLGIADLAYAWEQTGGPEVALADPTTARPSFVPGRPGTYAFTLTVSDGTTEATATTKVTVQR